MISAGVNQRKDPNYVVKKKINDEFFFRFKAVEKKFKKIKFKKSLNHFYYNVITINLKNN